MSTTVSERGRSLDWGAVARRADRPWLVMVVALLLWCSFAGLQYRRYGSDVSRFVMAGERLADAEAVPEGLTVWRDSWGYDGQFFYRLALEPFTTTLNAYGIPLLPPAYRQQRILYPLLAHLLAFGQASWVPFTLVLVNLLALLVLGYLGGLYAQGTGHHAFFGLPLALYPGYMVTLSRDLSEIVMAMLLLAGLLALQRKHHGWAALWLTLAVLARETALLVPAGLGVAYLLQTALAYKKARSSAHRPPSPGEILGDRQVLTFVLPCLVYVLWHVWLWQAWSADAAALTKADSNFSFPLLGLVTFVQRLSGSPEHLPWLWSAELVGLAILLIAAARAMRSGSASRGLEIAWGLYLLMALCMSASVWVEDYAYLRALTELCLLSYVILLQARGRTVSMAALLWTASWFVLAGDLMFIR